jgi:hypothetical protein
MSRSGQVIAQSTASQRSDAPTSYSLHPLTPGLDRRLFTRTRGECGRSCDRGRVPLSQEQSRPGHRPRWDRMGRSYRVDQAVEEGSPSDKPGRVLRRTHEARGPAGVRRLGRMTHWTTGTFCAGSWILGRTRKPTRWKTCLRAPRYLGRPGPEPSIARRPPWLSCELCGDGRRRGRSRRRGWRGCGSR